MPPSGRIPAFRRLSHRQWLSPLRELMALPRPPPETIMIANYFMQIGALQYAAANRERLPRGLFLASFDNPELAAVAGIPGLSIAQPIDRIGRRAAEVLLGRIRGTDHSEFVRSACRRRSSTTRDRVMTDSGDRISYATRVQTAALFVALITAGSFVAIPLPGSPVPIVLQNLFVVLAGVVLPPPGLRCRRRFICFSVQRSPGLRGATGGIAHFAGPTGAFFFRIRSSLRSQGGSPPADPLPPGTSVSGGSLRRFPWVFFSSTPSAFHGLHGRPVCPPLQPFSSGWSLSCRAMPQGNRHRTPRPLSPPFGMASIHLTDITVSAGDPPRDLLSRVNARFESGTISLILGANGSGKSMLLRTLLGCNLTGKVRLRSTRKCSTATFVSSTRRLVSPFRTRISRSSERPSGRTWPSLSIPPAHLSMSVRLAIFLIDSASESSAMLLPGS
jgi:hypothetical protein